MVGREAEIELRDDTLVALGPDRRGAVTVWLPTTSCPQFPTATVPAVTGCPLTTRFVTPLPLALPPAPE